jgi:hypothetical protein
MGLSSNGYITGTPTSTGTYPFTVQVTDSATPTAITAQANLSITVNAAPTCVSGGSESLLSGQYAILLKGFDNGTGTGETSPQPVLVGGVLTFNGTNNSGLITAGTIDMNLNAGVQTNLPVTSGSYGVTSDHRGCMVITTSAGTQNYRFSLGNITSGVASTGHVINFDTTGPFTAGVLRKQSGSFSNATLNGSFAFGGSSIQNAAPAVGGGKFGLVGEITFNGSGGITGGSEDFNQNGLLDGSSTTNFPTSPFSINSVGSSYSIGSNGRGTLILAVGGATGTSNTVVYVVSSSEVLFMTSDPQTTNTIVGGEALKQSGTPFSANPLSGAYVGYQSSLGSTAGTSRITLLLLNASGSGLSGTQLRNDGGSFQSKSLSSITYSVTSTGRMTISVVGATNQPIFYLVSANQAFFVNGNTSVDTGFFQSQTGGPFSNTSASGTYAFATIDPQDANSGDNSGVATFTPATTTIGVTEDNNSNGSQNTGQTQSFTYSIDSTGLVHIPSGCTISATSTTCQTVLYVISPTKAVIMDTTSTNPKVQVADQ